MFNGKFIFRVNDMPRRAHERDADVDALAQTLRLSPVRANDCTPQDTKVDFMTKVYESHVDALAQTVKLSPVRARHCTMQNAKINGQVQIQGL